MTELPTFKSPLLNNICRRLEARGKALKHQGKLTWETKQPDEFEWISVYFTPVVGHYVILQLVEDNRATVFVRCSGRKRRGKILLELKDINLISNADAIVEAFEATISQSISLSIDEESEAAELICEAWANTQIQITEDQD